MTSACQKPQGVDNLFLIADVVHAALVGSETDAANGSDLGVSLTDGRRSSMPSRVLGDGIDEA
jgi:hypothetical protein